MIAGRGKTESAVPLWKGGSCNRGKGEPDSFGLPGFLCCHMQRLEKLAVGCADPSEEEKGKVKGMVQSTKLTSSCKCPMSISQGAPRKISMGGSQPLRNLGM